MKFSSICYLLLCVSIIFETSCNAQNTTEKNKKETISAEKILKKIAANENIYYCNAVISGDLDFTGIKEENDEAKGSLRSYIASSVSFLDCVFEGKLILSKNDKAGNHFVTFEKNLTFLNCTFKDEVNLKESVISGMANFTGSTFEKKATFEGAVFSYKNTYFSETKFNDELKCQRIVTAGNLSFFKTVFEGITSFQNGSFGGDVQFGAAKFKQYADFGNVIAHAGFYFNYAEFSNKAIFNSSFFKFRTEFVQSKFNDIAEFKKSTFYGLVVFSNAIFKKSINFENAVFMVGKPTTDGIVKSDSTEISLKNTLYFEQKPLNLTDF